MTQSEFVERRREVLDAFLAEKPVEVVSLTEEETAQSRAVDR
jgi:predicted transcriptional regulator